MKVLVTDAEYKHTLAAVRCLGKNNCEVTVAGKYKLSCSFYSKYIKKKVISPDPNNESAYLDWLLSYLDQNHIDVLLPIGYYSTRVIAKNANRLSAKVNFALADWSAMEVAGNKDKTLEFAANLGIPMPRTYSFDDSINFPVVAKKIRGSGSVKYINDRSHLEAIAQTDYVLQEYIPGEGYGFYALFDHGEPKAIFMHRRIREYPATGGASTACESVYDENLKTAGLKVLRNLNWHGVAMVEFKKDKRDGLFKLIEINPKFWGSLDLSIQCGVPFPYLTCRLANNETIHHSNKYILYQRFSWLFPDEVLHLIDRPKSFFPILNDIFNNRCKTNIELFDIKPTWVQLYETWYFIKLGIKNRTLRKSHGVPKYEGV